MRIPVLEYAPIETTAFGGGLNQSFADLLNYLVRPSPHISRVV